MNSNQIKCFLSVGRTLSFTKSATDLYLSQSTISKNIKNLEKELDFALLDRSHQQVKLTPKGKIFFEQMLKINHEIENLISQLSSTEEHQVPTVYLGYTDIPFESSYLPLAIRLINQKVKIHLRTRIIDPNNSVKLYDLLKQGDLDFLVFQHDYFEKNQDTEFVPLLQNGFSVLVNNSDPLFLKPFLKISDLNNRNIWLWNTREQLPTVAQLFNKINSSKVKCNIETITDSMVLNDYVLSNKGIGIVPGVLYEKSETSLRYIPLKCDIPIFYGIAFISKTKEKIYFNKVINSFKQAIDITKEKW